VNVTEANATQAVLTWLLDPHAGPDAEATAREAAGLLADRSYATLGAGLEYLEVLDGWLTLLEGCPGCSTCTEPGAVPR
jgi:hypothetical protein